MRVLVTGADGFVGRYLLEELLEHSHLIVACHAGPPPDAGRPQRAGLTWAHLDVTENASVAKFVGAEYDAVVHLAALASGVKAREDPAAAWSVNAGGTARVLEQLAKTCQGTARPVVLVVSTLEVYGVGPHRPRRETDPLRPVSPYAASKVGAEFAAMEVSRRFGIPLVIARPTGHTGPGQSKGYVVPDFVDRIRRAEKEGAATVPTGNLDPVRDFLHVTDVVRAYRLLLEHGRSGRIYNVGSGQGTSIGQLFAELAARMDVEVRAQEAPGLRRNADIPHLVADPSKLTRATGWTPKYTLSDVLQSMACRRTA